MGWQCLITVKSKFHIHNQYINDNISKHLHIETCLCRSYYSKTATDMFLTLFFYLLWRINVKPKARMFDERPQSLFLKILEAKAKPRESHICKYYTDMPWLLYRPHVIGKAHEHDVHQTFLPLETWPQCSTVPACCSDRLRSASCVSLAWESLPAADTWKQHIAARKLSSVSTWLSVNSSHGHVVTRSTHHRSTRHTSVSSQASK